jgi:hypothetical protein
MEGVAKGDPGEAVSIQAPWAAFYGARNNELLQRKTGNKIREKAAAPCVDLVGKLQAAHSFSAVSL